MTSWRISSFSKGTVLQGVSYYKSCRWPNFSDHLYFLLRQIMIIPYFRVKGPTVLHTTTGTGEMSTALDCLVIFLLSLFPSYSAVNLFLGFWAGVTQHLKTEYSIITYVHEFSILHCRFKCATLTSTYLACMGDGVCWLYEKHPIQNRNRSLLLFLHENLPRQHSERIWMYCNGTCVREDDRYIILAAGEHNANCNLVLK